jgi:hypothetical protein
MQTEEVGADENIPTEQRVHAEEANKLVYVPASQSRHILTEMAPVMDRYFPETHLRQALAPIMDA